METEHQRIMHSFSLQGISNNPNLRASAARIACLPHFVAIFRSRPFVFAQDRLVLLRTLNY
jgi:hypothetical protein